MLKGKPLEQAANYLSNEQKDILKESYSSLDEGIRELYQIGADIQLAEESISPDDLQRFTKNIEINHQLDEFEDYEIIDFLVCFELGFSKKLAPILQHRKKLKLICGGLIFAAHRFSKTNYHSHQKLSITEETISNELLAAQNARWECDFNKCGQIINLLEQSVHKSNLSKTIRHYWTTGINDLKVESLFTVSDSKNYHNNISLADKTLDGWRKQRNYIKLTHAFLRKAVLFRQQLLLRIEGRLPLFEMVDTLRDAEKEVVQPLTSQKNNIEARNTLFSFYCEIAKSYAQSKEFSLSWAYYQRAERILNELESEAPRRRLDLARARAIILSEQVSARNLYEINQLETSIEEMQMAVEKAEKVYSQDVVLREILIKDLIPLLAIAGNTRNSTFREEAQNLLFASQKQAQQLKLFHQQRGLKLIADKFSLHMR